MCVGGLGLCCRPLGYFIVCLVIYKLWSVGNESVASGRLAVRTWHSSSS